VGNVCEMLPKTVYSYIEKLDATGTSGQSRTVSLNLPQHCRQLTK